MKFYYGSYTLNDSCGSSHVRSDAQTKMKSDLCMLLHHALHWAVYKTSQFMRLWYLSHMQPAKAQTSLHIRTGGEGGGGRIASQVRFVPVFLPGNKWQLMIFMGRSGPPAPSVSAHIRVSNSLNSHFILFIFLLGLVNSQNVC